MGSYPPAYQATEGGALSVDRELYDRIAVEIDGRVPVEQFTIPIRSGRAWEIPAGHVCRITTPEGPQVGDLNVWNRADPRERMWASRTRQLQRAHITTYDRIWSNLPFLRPLLTVTGDSLADYGTSSSAPGSTTTTATS
jgi:uncharacterized protein